MNEISATDQTELIAKCDQANRLEFRPFIPKGQRKIVLLEKITCPEAGLRQGE
jgi:hypothetical protein